MRRDDDRGVKLFDNQRAGNSLFEQVPSTENPGIEFTVLRAEVGAAGVRLRGLFCRLTERHTQLAEGQALCSDGCLQPDADNGNGIVFTTVSIRLFMCGMKAFGQNLPDVSGLNLSRNPKGQFRRLALIAQVDQAFIHNTSSPIPKTPLIPSILLRPGHQRVKFPEQSRGINRVQILRHALHIVGAQVGHQQAQRAEHPREKRNIHPRHAQIVGQRRRVQRA